MNWKLEIAKLRTDAHAVFVTGPLAHVMGAREVARVLSGVVELVVRKHGLETAQRACAELVLDRKALESGLTRLPREIDGTLDPSIEMIAVVARGMLACSSIESVRAALSFWASERDPARWQEVVGLAA